jgi:hypothetical protein
MRAIIRYMQEKLKSWLRNDQVFYGLLLVLVGLGSFALGRLSVTPVAISPALGVTFIEAKASPTVNQGKVMPAGSQTVDTESSANDSPKSATTVVASKSGTKYHLLSCAGAKQIKPENLLTFPNSEEAERAGYTPAANCPGLQ